MRPEGTSGASGCPQAQENSTEHPRAGRTCTGRTCAEPVGDDAHSGCTSARTYSYARTDDHAYAYAYARAGFGSRRHACEPNALSSRALSFFP
jgi:hypothetical protein